jgi:ubiquinol-cytochrome c reductase cytochrome b subunit
MFSAILIILTLTFGDLAKLRGIQFKPLNKIVFFIFVGNLLLLMVLGAKHVESPFIEIGQIATLIYFVYFTVIVPLATIFENSINEFYTNMQNKLKGFGFAKHPTSHSYTTRSFKSTL